MKRFLPLALRLAGAALLLAAVLLAAVATAQRDVIGGADLPTFWFVLLHGHGGLYAALAVVGVLSFLVSLYAIGQKTRKK